MVRIDRETLRKSCSRIAHGASNLSIFPPLFLSTAGYHPFFLARELLDGCTNRPFGRTSPMRHESTQYEQLSGQIPTHSDDFGATPA